MIDVYAVGIVADVFSTTTSFLNEGTGSCNTDLIGLMNGRDATVCAGSDLL